MGFISFAVGTPVVQQRKVLLYRKRNNSVYFQVKMMCYLDENLPVMEFPHLKTRPF